QAIQAELRALVGDVSRLDARAGRLQRHFEAAAEDLRQVRLTGERVAARAGRIDVLQLERTAPDPVAEDAGAEAARRAG
ncbi:MAG: hypothetical protein ACXWVJ_04705, partial [Caulobacteraceae bacterium]